MAPGSSARRTYLLAPSSDYSPTPRARSSSKPFVYATGGAIATRNDSTSTLTPIPAPVLGFPAVIEAKDVSGLPLQLPRFSSHWSSIK
jgi:hypothetical protein